uniref:Uncharacterized protein n=1 Tax=Sphaerodactylus townsendi TaxID=933632 RepID=A0ACB8FWU2_9SAUR
MKNPKGPYESLMFGFDSKAVDKSVWKQRMFRWEKRQEDLKPTWKAKIADKLILMGDKDESLPTSTTSI